MWETLSQELVFNSMDVLPTKEYHEYSKFDIVRHHSSGFSVR